MGFAHIRSKDSVICNYNFMVLHPEINEGPQGGTSFYAEDTSSDRHKKDVLFQIPDPFAFTIGTRNGLSCVVPWDGHMKGCMVKWGAMSPSNPLQNTITEWSILGVLYPYQRPIRGVFGFRTRITPIRGGRWDFSAGLDPREPLNPPSYEGVRLRQGDQIMLYPTWHGGATDLTVYGMVTLEIETEQ